MSAVGLESIDHTVQLTHIWINDLDARLGSENKHRSYRLLRTVLQTMRDWLMVNEAAGLGAQLPELLRGVYYEHWRPATTPVKKRSKLISLRASTTLLRPIPLSLRPTPLVPCSSSFPTRSRPVKLSMYIMPCRQTSERFGLFLRKQPENARTQVSRLCLM